ncbi:MAG TPA: c-type cytochrome [Gemmatimonadales bacterium]|nr:c-type cytochrome [Gemmatimonadales bacterium]
MTFLAASRRFNAGGDVVGRSTHHRRLWGLLAIVGLAVPVCVMGQTTAQDARAAAITEKGNDHGVPACVSCHGPHLLGNPALGYPRIAGQSAPYVTEQLEALASGTRKNPLMMPIAKALTPAEREALAHYLSGLPVGRAPTPDTLAQRADSATRHAGEVLAMRGRWADTLPACDRCHGPGGIGVGTAFPPLAGQPVRYLTDQLHMWQQGTRGPGPLDLMSTIAKRMSEEDVAAVAAYYALQPPTPPTAKASRP